MPEFKRGTENEIWQIVQENVKIFFMQGADKILRTYSAGIDLMQSPDKSAYHFMQEAISGKIKTNDRGKIIKFRPENRSHAVGGTSAGKIGKIMCPGNCLQGLFYRIKIAFFQPAPAEIRAHTSPEKPPESENSL